MNIVRRGQRGQLGQFDPSGTIIMDAQYGPEDTPIISAQPDYGSTSTTGFSDYGAPSVPQPSSSPQPAPTTHSPILATFGPYGTTDPTAGGYLTAPGVAVPSPAPRVNIPLSTPSGLLASSVGGIPMLAIAGIGIIALLALSGGGGRRRR